MYLQFAVNCNIISGQLGCKRPLACGTCGSHMAYFLAPKGLKPHASTARVMWMKRTASLLDTLSLYNIRFKIQTKWANKRFTNEFNGN